MINIIPKPKSIIEMGGTYSFSKKSACVAVDPRLSDIEPMIKPILGFQPAKEDKDAVIRLVFNQDSPNEGYSLICDKSGITIYAGTYSGAFYALQTLRQLLDTDLSPTDTLVCPLVKIQNDEPRYTWRGLQLDESRHFFGMETVKKLLDFMAMHKLNIFHWHLTDDQGWRIEIDKYPLLTEIGSKREYSQMGNWKSLKCESKPVSGYYTKDEIREVIKYAKERCIDIVPEIDFPAHSAAAIAAYKSLACRELDRAVPGYFGGIVPQTQGISDWNRTLCLGKDEVYEFVYDVLGEVAELFPFKYFHVGGDEAPTGEWKKCPLCQKKMKENGLTNETQLQGYFTNCINRRLKELGKVMVGWNEILRSNIDRDIVAQYWTPKRDRNVTEHINKGGKVIMSCHKAFYFDMRYTYVTVKNTYEFNPVNNNIPKQLLSSVLGLEGENWTEWTDEENELFFKMARRAMALAENAWTLPENKDYAEFCQRMAHNVKRVEKTGIYCGKEEFTMHSAELKKRILAKKQGLTMADFDCEYELDAKC